MEGRQDKEENKNHSNVEEEEEEEVKEKDAVGWRDEDAIVVL